MNKVCAYFKEILTGFDQTANAVLGGSCDETLSSRCYRNSLKYWYARALMRVIDVLAYPFEGGQWHHCRDSYLSEYAKRHDPQWQNNLTMEGKDG